MPIERVLTEVEARIWPVYLALWAKFTTEDGVFVSYDGVGENGEGGWFHPGDEATGPGRPKITICRACYPYPSDEPSPVRNDGSVDADDEHRAHPDLLQELITLAHECGHYVSFTQGNCTQEYRAAARAQKTLLKGPENIVSKEQETIYMADEHRAWAFGRKELEALGFQEWEAFDAAHARALREYERIFSGAIWQS